LASLLIALLLDFPMDPARWVGGGIAPAKNGADGAHHICSVMHCIFV
jgi:hypothetical protein